MRQAAAEAPGRAAAGRSSGSNGQALRPPAYGMDAADRLTPPAPGEPLPAALGSVMGQRFGQSFGDVRVHAGQEAAALAKSMGARAYTVGPSIVFGEGQYRPGAPDGQRLIAHELTHVVQQRGSPAAVQPRRLEPSGDADPAEREADRAADAVMSGAPAGPVSARADPGRLYRYPYETRGISLNRGDIATMRSENYWSRRTNERYGPPAVSQRMQSDPEEHDAVLAALWSINPPATVTKRTERIVPIARPVPPAPASPAAPAAPAAPASPVGSPASAAASVPAPAPPAPLLYRFIFTPPATKGGKPGVACEFIAAGPGAIPAAAPAPAAGFAGKPLTGDAEDFPGTGRDDYFSKHPDELAQLQSFLASAGATFDQMVTLTTTDRAGKVTHQTLVHAVGAPLTSAAPLTLTFVSETAANSAQTVQSDYHTLDAEDFELEKLRRTSRPAGDRLGQITWPAGMPDSEKLPVKLAIETYFTAPDRPARKTEVDAILPVDATGDALYQLRFGAHNDVTVTRIGAAGTGKDKVDTSRFDVMRINGFPGLTATDAALRAWWTSRYPAASKLISPVPGPPPPPPTSGAAFPTFPNAPLILEMTTKLATEANTAAWFSGNYGITILDGAALATRLTSVHSVPATLLTDTVDFSAGDFKSLELALETMSPADIANLKGVNIGRKTTSFQKVNQTWQAGGPDQYGLSLWASSGGTQSRTTVYFDSIRQSDKLLFRGSTADNALPDSAMNMIHELGHDTGYKDNIEAAFTTWRAAHMAQAPAPTWYAASGATEVFPEYYGLFHTDPHFLCGAAPQVYAWFAELARTGTPPAANATLTPPATCPD